VLRRWPGYTIATLMAEDAGLVLQTLALLDLAKED